jgi:molecular chaperone DnaK (HSP70)
MLHISSTVGFTKHARLIGHEAEVLAAAHPTDVVYHIKRMLGREYKDKCLQKHLLHYPFTVAAQHTNTYSTCDSALKYYGAPSVEQWVLGERCKMGPEQLCAQLLTQLAQMAEAFTGDLLTLFMSPLLATVLCIHR